MTIGTRINALRKAKGYSQGYVAEQLHVTRQAVSKWEQDQTSPDTWNLIELAKLLDSSVEFITLGRQDVPPESKTVCEHTESFCGKFCSSCTLKTELNCPGCKARLQQDNQHQCDISNCCHSRNLQACWQCKFSSSCKRLNERNFIAEKRRERINAERKILEIRRELVLGCKTWMMMLPVVAIVYLVALEVNVFVPFVPFIPGALYAFCLFQLRHQSDSYKTAALFMLLLTVVQAFADILPGDQGHIKTVLGVVTVIINLIRLRCEYVGHQDISTFFDCDLTDSYSRLWKWYLIFPALEVFALVFIRSPLFFLPALIVLLVSLIGVVLVHVIHIRNLFSLKKLMIQV